MREGIEDRSDIRRAVGEPNREGRPAKNFSEEKFICRQFPPAAHECNEWQGQANFFACVEVLMTRLQKVALNVLPKQGRFSTGRTIQRIAELLRRQYCLKFSEEELEEALDYLIRIGKLVRIFMDGNFYYHQPFKNR